MEDGKFVNNLEKKRVKNSIRRIKLREKAVPGIFYIFSISLALISFVINVILKNKPDYAIYYYTSREFVFGDPLKIYDANWMRENHGIQEFRYFPSILLFYFIFSILPFGFSYIIILVVIICSNFLNLKYTFFTMQTLKKDAGNARYLMLILSILPSYMSLLGQGQAIALASLFFSLSLNKIIQKKYMCSFLFLGISILFKPVYFLSLVLILFVFLVDRKIKIIFKALVVISLIFIPDLVIFLSIPGLLGMFIDLNFGSFGFENRIGLKWLSISFRNLTGMIMDFNQLLLTIVIFLIFLLTNIIIIVKQKRCLELKNRIFFVFYSGAFGFFMFFPDIWRSQVIMIAPVQVIAIYLVDGRRLKQFLAALLFMGSILSELVVFNLVINEISLKFLIISLPSLCFFSLFILTMITIQRKITVDIASK